MALAPPPVADMMRAIVERGITPENVEALTQLTTLYERMEDRRAESQFAQAFMELQAAIPRIEANKPVPDKNGNVKYHFAPYEEIMEKVRPVLQQHGFSVSFSSEFDGPRVVQFCTLHHVGGHKRTNRFAVRVGSGPPGSSEAQGDGAASTYAKRFALCDALNIVIEKDLEGDARLEGDSVTAEQARTLRALVEETKSDKAKFLRYAGAESFETIQASRFDRLLSELERKQRQ